MFKWTKSFFCTSEHVAVAVSMKLMIPRQICYDGFSGTCPCMGDPDESKYLTTDMDCMFHSVRCMNQLLQITRHDTVAKEIAIAVNKKHKGAARLEPVYHPDNDNNSRGDIRIRVDGKTRYFDVVVCHPFMGNSMGHAAGVAEKRKRRELDNKISDHVDFNKDLFFPLAFESTGTLGPETREKGWKTIKELLGSKDREYDDEYNEIRTRVVMSRISSLVWNNLASRYLRLLSCYVPRTEIV